MSRKLPFYFARRATNLSLAQLAETLQMKSDATVSMAVKRYQMKLAKDQRERQLSESVGDMLNVGI